MCVFILVHACMCEYKWFIIYNSQATISCRLRGYWQYTKVGCCKGCTHTACTTTEQTDRLRVILVQTLSPKQLHSLQIPILGRCAIFSLAYMLAAKMIISHTQYTTTIFLPAVGDDTARFTINVEGGEEGVGDASDGGGVGLGRQIAVELLNRVHLSNALHWEGFTHSGSTLAV